jgi:hypothetical protein
MRYPRVLVALVMVLAFAACDSDTTGPSENWQAVSGSYSGVMAGLSQGVAMDATFSMTLTQTRGDLGGAYAIQGVLTDGIDWVDVQGTGILSGSVGQGNNPSVNVTATSGFCTNKTVLFSGAYDSSNRRLTLTGPVEFYNDDCVTVLSYQTTMILTR